ncbi:hypothetical protein EPUS_06337 [Endocarpon pusillum Z07020]|uniref:non-specific serine/threonine protein kinase n=1 Tax=Endocarpon pusillum (strain Z07020 / HMAS-L-300199) TaxID=1263415 RepID=U1GEY1_ENDPU|nr:uncharacterized protein EPUS_06337 [Endocarpon pusillum Z07020]ERF70296.1 hypothetical protein EPUS_06337 [Endocarpon pusillum Z07020]
MATPPGSYYSEVDAEPLERYYVGGYHPTHLGDTFRSGRYKILHKLGWGGYATVWLARDSKLKRNVAIKILVSESSPEDHELRMLKLLSDGPLDHPGRKNTMQMLEHFDHVGPKGRHRCLVLELLGPNISLEAESYDSDRLPGRLAWEVTKQTTQALDYIHKSGIAHGGNIVFANTGLSHQSDVHILSSMDQTETSDVHASPGYPLNSHLPRSLVAPTSLPVSTKESGSWEVKVVDFGQAFMHGDQREIRCPLVFRAPEVILTSQWDSRIDIWSLGCTIFEIIVGYPPFDNMMPTREGLVREWIAMFGQLPEGWSDRAADHKENADSVIEPVTLRKWLFDTYFENDKKADFSGTDMERLADLLASMLTYLPCARPQAAELLEHAWFQTNSVVQRYCTEI